VSEFELDVVVVVRINVVHLMDVIVDDVMMMKVETVLISKHIFAIMMLIDFSFSLLSGPMWSDI